MRSLQLISAIKTRWSKGHDRFCALSLQWRNNELDGVSNYQRLDCCLLNHSLVEVQINENIKAPLHWTFWGEFTSEFPTQRASNAENVSIWWRHQVYCCEGNNGRALVCQMANDTMYKFIWYTYIYTILVAWRCHISLIFSARDLLIL